jgi:hypothetical protein
MLATLAAALAVAGALAAGQTGSAAPPPATAPTGAPAPGESAAPPAAPSEAAPVTEPAAPATDKKTQAATPEHFEPTEKVRADFAVSFPVDI